MKEQTPSTTATYPRLETVKLSDIKSPVGPTRAYRPEDRLLLKKSVEYLTMLRPMVTVNARTGNLLDGGLAVQLFREEGGKSCLAMVVDIDPAREPAARMALQNHAGEWDWKSVSDALLATQASGGQVLTSGFRDSDTSPLMAADWSPAPVGPLDGSCHQQIGLL